MTDASLLPTVHASLLAARRQVDNAIAAIEDAAAHGNQMPDNARKIAAFDDMLAALKALTERHASLVNSGDCGFWDPETEQQMIAARAAIAKAEGRS
jgi:hypothetical protein